MSSLTAIFGSSAEKEQDSEKLMDLYWNRAELKKEFAGMRKEQFQLKDKIKKQDAMIARGRQKLDHLEGLLADPEWAHNVVVHFQLRGLSDRCQNKLASFAELLKQQREQKQHESLLGEWHTELAQEAEQVQQQILDKQEYIHRLEDQLQAERRRLTSMSAIARLFKGRSITTTLDDLAEQVETAQQEENALGEEIDAVRDREPPDTQGLDIPTKRSINFMILAFAQQIYLHFEEEELAALIRDATDRSVGTVNYGNRDDCMELLRRMQSSADELEQSTDFAGDLQKRARTLSEHAKFQDNSGAVPSAATVARLIRIDGDGVVTESELDMLGENYWGIAQMLSR